MVAWRRLVDVKEPSMKPSVAGQLLGLFTGISRVMSKHGWRSSSVTACGTNHLSATMKVGIELQQLDVGALKKGLLLSDSRSPDWNVSKNEVLGTRKAQPAARAMQMESGALGSRGKDNKSSNYDLMRSFSCGKTGPLKTECRAAGGGAANDSRIRGKLCNGGKGARAKNSDEKGPTRWI